jgi:predicted thioredoxin/glutaredoxin
VLEVLIDGAGELVQSVAIEVVPPVVDALDVDAVVKRLDVDAIVERIDIDALLAKVDVNALMERVDIDAVLARTEFGTVVSRSAGAVAGQALDILRSQGVGLDAFIERWTARLLRRGRRTGPAGPPLYFKDQSGTTP